jgi:subtilase family serine protease
VLIMDPSGNPVTPVYDMLGDPNGTIGLSGVDPAYDHLVVSEFVEADSALPSPWDAPDPPTIITRIAVLPHLTG